MKIQYRAGCFYQTESHSTREKAMKTKPPVEKAIPKAKAAGAAASSARGPVVSQDVEQQKKEFEDARIQAAAEYGITAGIGSFRLR